VESGRAKRGSDKSGIEEKRLVEKGRHSMKHPSILAAVMITIVVFGLSILPRNAYARTTSRTVGIVGAVGGSTALNCGPDDANTLVNGCLPITDPAFSGFNFTALGLPLPALSSFDTVVLNMGSPGLTCKTSSLSSADKAALVSFMTSGGKLLIYDSECTPTVDYSFLPTALQFTTQNPGAGSHHGTATIVENDTLANANPSSPQYIDLGPPSPGGTAAGFCVYGGGHWPTGGDCGDFNVMVVRGTDLCKVIDASIGSTTGTVVAYSRDRGAAGNGFFVYDGTDRDVTMPSTQHVTAPTSSGGGAVIKLWLQELQQPWNPSGLACSNPITPTTLTTSTTAITSISGPGWGAGILIVLIMPIVILSGVAASAALSRRRPRRVCYLCGRELEDDARFCDRCGVIQPP
jgi:hypothetical protein